MKSTMTGNHDPGKKTDDEKNSTSFPEVKETEVPGEAERVRKIAEKYRDVFSSHLNPTPAKLDAMKLNVKEEE